MRLVYISSFSKGPWEYAMDADAQWWLNEIVETVDEPAEDWIVVTVESAREDYGVSVPPETPTK